MLKKPPFRSASARKNDKRAADLANCPQLLIEQVLAILPCWLSKRFRLPVLNRTLLDMFILDGAASHIAGAGGRLF
jgi:hypothetical protein